MKKHSGMVRVTLRGAFAGVLLGFAAVAQSMEMPAIVAHRGESNDRPENTMAAFRLAFERGIWGVECDVHTTLDGVPVILHDDSTGRTAGAATNLVVSESTWAELKNVRVGAFGKWIGSEWESETLPKFEDYLALLARNGTSKCVVELKGGGTKLVTKVAAAIRAQPLATKDRVVFISFDSNLIRLIRTELPAYPAWLLLGEDSYTGNKLLQKIRACNATGVNLHQASSFDAEDVAAVKAAGCVFAVWTCDDTEKAHALARMGVDVITSNRAKALGDTLAGLIARDNAEIRNEALADGAFPMDAGLYIQEGLAAHFDGIRNAGLGKPHNPRARIWQNLVDGAPNAVFSNTNGFWNVEGNGFVFPQNVYAALSSGLAPGAFPTIQMATEIDCTEQLSGNQCRPTLFHSAKDDSFSLFFANTTGAVQQLTLKASAYAGGRPTLVWHGRYVTAMLGTNGFNYLVEGTSLSGGVVRRTTNPVPSRAFSWGGSPWNISAKRHVQGTIHSVRIYDRNLSERELVWNRLIDDARYHGIMSHGCVVVSTSVPGAEGNEPSGLYFVNGHHDFTVPASVEVGGCEWEAAGYIRDFFDADRQTWVYDGEHSGMACSITNCTAVPGVRITWKWRRKPDNPSDADSDGIPDWWEILHFGSPDGCNPSDDSDNDGFSNREEYFLGTNPDDASSLFAATYMPGDKAHAGLLTWPSATGTVYAIWGTTDLQSGFELLENGIEATPPSNHFSIPPTPPIRFFRISATIP